MMNKQIPLYNRCTDVVEYERVFEQGFMDFVYGTKLGNALEKALIIRPAFSLIYGYIQNSSFSRKKITAFIEDNDIDVSEFEASVESFRSFNEFFKRRLKRSSRPVDRNLETLISPCDGRLLSYPLEGEMVVPVKGVSFTLSALIGDHTVAERFEGGTCLIFRLAPMDYHRFCYIDNGIRHPSHTVNGVLHSVSQLSLEAMIPVFTENYREYNCLDTESFGEVLHMDVGALVVGKIQQNDTGKVAVTRGQEKGYFEFGGSTIILLFQRDRVEIDADIARYSTRGIETLVKMGEKVGRVKE